MAQLGGEWGDVVGLGGRQVSEKLFDLAGEVGGVVVTEGAEDSGEFVSDVARLLDSFG